MKRLQLNNGDIIGSGFVFITDTQNVPRKSILACPDCGGKSEFFLGNVLSLHTKSCGCKRMNYNGESHKKIGTLHRNIIKRCYDVDHKQFPSYGGRGIKMYKKWIYDFDLFCVHVKSLHGFNKEGRTLDRIDNDKGYYPGNLRWADRTIQTTNTRKRITNKSGFVGVRKLRNKFESRIVYKYDQKVLGLFNTINEAVDARNKFIIENGLPHKIQYYGN